MSTGILFAILIVATLAIGLIQRRRAHRHWVREEVEEEQGKYWDAGEQVWTSSRQKADLKARQEAFFHGTADLLAKQIIAFLLVEFPALTQLPPDQTASFKQRVGATALAFLRDIKHFGKTSAFEVEMPAEVLSAPAEGLKKRMMAFVYRENPHFQDLGAAAFSVLNRGVEAYVQAILADLPSTSTGAGK